MSYSVYKHFSIHISFPRSFYSVKHFIGKSVEYRKNMCDLINYYSPIFAYYCTYNLLYVWGGES